MAPEQVRGDRVTPACDVFCLGSVLAYAATGAPPFGSADSGVHALMFRIAGEEPDLAGVPEGLADLVRDCLRKDPEARPTLDRVLERTGVEDTVSDGRSRDPWLPGALVAQLGRHAVRLLEVEDPEGADTPADTARWSPTAPFEAAPQHSGPRGDALAPDDRPTLVAGPGGVPQQAHPSGAGPAPAHPAYGFPPRHPQQAPSAPGHGHHPTPGVPAPTTRTRRTPAAPAAPRRTPPTGRTNPPARRTRRAAAAERRSCSSWSPWWSRSPPAARCTRS